jgi:plastocyanin
MHVRRACLGLLAAALLAGCTNSQAPVNKRAHSGTGTASEGPGGVQTLVVTSGVDLRFHPSTLVVRPGKVRIVLDNTSKPGQGPPHDLQFGDLPGASIGTTIAGERQAVTFTAPAPGTYSFVCTIHAAQNQTGKLIVRR